ncbi:B-cell receptor CD22-like [Halichoeres trimaculatus]|uniref:B-cell receptor CD22-like n=1 Tax=Halichoeres trimaculatus TaxID=147232 RepID=UPI003D9F1DB7
MFPVLCVSEVRGQTDWGVTYFSHQICASKGSTVDIPCTYTYPPRIDELDTKVEETLWFTKLNGRTYVDLGSDPDYSGRVEYLFKQNDCTLRIKDLRESDSAKYTFRFTTNQEEDSVTDSPGVTLTVTGLRVVVESVWTEADLRCENSCKASDYPSYVCDSRLGVTYSSHQICASKGSTVDIPCTYTYPPVINHQTTVIQSVLWFTKTDYYRRTVDLRSDPDYSGRVEYLFNQNDCTLRIKDLRWIDSAEYKFRFTTNQGEGGVNGSPGVTLTVTGLQVVVKSVWTEADLRCESSCKVSDNPSYVWYKDGEKMDEQTSSLRVSDFGKSYSCALKNHEDQRSAAVYAPKTPSVSQSPSGEVTEGTSVTLTCSSDANPAATYTWYKRTVRKGRQTDWTSKKYFSYIQPSDSGEYYCLAENKLGKSQSEFFSIKVKYAPKILSVSQYPSGEVIEGRYVTLSCSSDGYPAPEFTWYKRNQHGHLRKGSELVFRSIQSSDSGQYSCSAKNDMGTSTSGLTSIDVKYAPKPPSVSVSPSGEIVEGSSVTLTCSSDANPAASYTWYKKTGNRGRQTDRKSQKYFSSIQSSDSGEYYCEAENKLGSRTSESISVKVKYPPKPPSVSVSPSGEIVEGSSVTLTCSSDANPAAHYTWYKKDEDPEPNPLGKGPQLLFKSIQSFDFGLYYCEAENELGRRKSEHTNVNVMYPPKLPSVSVSPSGEIVEGSSVTLTCSSDANPAANYTWYKKNEGSPKASGEIFTIENTGAEHSGDYVCVAQNEKGHHNSTVHVTVVGGSWKGITAATVSVIMIALILIFVAIWIIKKRTRKQESEPRERPDNCDQIQLSEQQNDLQYATIHFSKKQEESIYCNVKAAKPKRKKKTNEEEEDVKEELVEYSAVRFNRAGPAQSRNQETVEDPAALYSKVNKPSRNPGPRNL